MLETEERRISHHTERGVTVRTPFDAELANFNLESRSSFLIPFVFAFVFSDLSAFVAGYEYIYVFYFLERVLYLLSFYFS